MSLWRLLWSVVRKYFDNWRKGLRPLLENLVCVLERPVQGFEHPVGSTGLVLVAEISVDADAVNHCGSYLQVGALCALQILRGSSPVKPW